jgi:fructokinase
MNQSAVHVGIELGGTKVVVGASERNAELLFRETIATGDPGATLAAVTDSLEGLTDRYRVGGIGIASFGPIDLRPTSPTFGTMLATPKAGWSGVDVLGLLTVPGVDVAIDTDVNAALLAERAWGAGTSENLAYLTVGTGIGGAIYTGGGVVHGSNHPEVGHMRVPRHPEDSFPGVCPFHGDCLEGMASGTAIRSRWDVAADALGHALPDALVFESWYLAHAIASLCAIIPVDQVIVGGGVSKLPGLHASVASMLPQASGGYPPVPFEMGGPGVMAPGLGDDSGVVGAIELARGVV